MGLNLNLGNINKAAKDFTHRRTEVPEETMRDVGIEVIKADPQQPRKEFDDDALKELADSIKTHGLIQPIVLRPSPDKEGEFYIIAGERRFRAVKLNGDKTIRAIVKKTFKPEEIGYVQMAESQSECGRNRRVYLPTVGDRRKTSRCSRKIGFE